MGFTLVPRELKFFDMFDQMAATLTRAGVKFFDMVTAFDELPKRSLELKQEEEIGDELVERIINALDQSFITPFDREDIHQLATSMDDVLDNMEETSYRFQEFRIEKPTAPAVNHGSASFRRSTTHTTTRSPAAAAGGTRPVGSAADRPR